MTTQPVYNNFDRAAAHYDDAATMQTHVAQRLVDMAVRHVENAPQAILDIGCGTGLVAQAANRAWPHARLAGIDASPAMLAVARRKLPAIGVYAEDIAHKKFTPGYDAVFSSMALHWLSDPCAALREWQKALYPGGGLFVALLVDGSFQEWKELCADDGIASGLWPLPRHDFADALRGKTEEEIFAVDYPSAAAFLRRLKTTGAAKSREGHKPTGTATMRNLLTEAPQPFAITYRILYIQMSAPNSI